MGDALDWLVGEELLNLRVHEGLMSGLVDAILGGERGRERLERNAEAVGDDIEVEVGGRRERAPCSETMAQRAWDGDGRLASKGGG